MRGEIQLEEDVEWDKNKENGWPSVSIISHTAVRVRAVRGVGRVSGTAQLGGWRRQRPEVAVPLATQRYSFTSALFVDFFLGGTLRYSFFAVLEDPTVHNQPLQSALSIVMSMVVCGRCKSCGCVCNG